MSTPNVSALTPEESPPAAEVSAANAVNATAQATVSSDLRFAILLQFLCPGLVQPECRHNRLSM